MRIPRPALLVALITACAQTPSPREAAQIPLPAHPASADLVEFRVGNNSSNQFLVDRRSLSIHADGEINLTLIVRSPAGAETVTHEGIRCHTAEYRILAVARPGGQWSRLADPAWRRIEYQGPNRHRAALASDYLCDGVSAVRTPDEALTAMQDPTHLRHGPGGAP